jgi:hypothetical protein
MEWLKPLKGRTVGLDTAPLIYFMEEHATYLPLVKHFFKGMEQGEFFFTNDRNLASSRDIKVILLSELL